MNETTHYIPAFTEINGPKQRAVCGVWIRQRDHVCEPSCADCARWLNADAAEAAKFGSVEEQAVALFGEPTPAPPVFARDPEFSSTAAYATRKAAR